MTFDHVVEADGLTGRQREQLAENWVIANHCFDDMLDRWRRHRADGCPHWFCMDGETAAQVDVLGLSQVHQLLRVAAERLL